MLIARFPDKLLVPWTVNPCPIEALLDVVSDPPKVFTAGSEAPDELNVAVSVNDVPEVMLP